MNLKEIIEVESIIDLYIQYNEKSNLTNKLNLYKEVVKHITKLGYYKPFTTYQLINSILLLVKLMCFQAE